MDKTKEAMKTSLMWNSSVLNITYLNKELHVFNINVKSSIGAENVFS